MKPSTKPAVTEAPAATVGRNAFPSLSFDGCGINGRDAYRTRIATFARVRSDEARQYGPMFAHAPDLLAFVEAYEEYAKWGNAAITPAEFGARMRTEAQRLIALARPAR